MIKMPYHAPVILLALLLLFPVGNQTDDTDIKDPAGSWNEQREQLQRYNTGSGKKDQGIASVADTNRKFTKFALAAAHPLATGAGYRILESGGSAVDAAVAIQMVLTLVEPQSSGIGGGAFLMHWDGSTVTAYDGRETAPSGVDETLFLDDDGDPLPFEEAVHSGFSVGVPGTLAMLKVAHDAHGHLPWAELFRPAITLADEGFSLSPRLHEQIASDERLADDEQARQLFFDDNSEPRPPGYRLRNPALAEIFRMIAKYGTEVFYEGKIAEDMVRRVRQHPRPGELTREDLSAYPMQDLQRDPVCTPWNEYTICGFPPPSSGHLTIMQILGILEYTKPAFSVGADNLPDPDWLHRFLEASKLAYADRNRYIADPDYVGPPGDAWEVLLDREYLEKRAALIGETCMGVAEPGSFDTFHGRHPEQPDRGTSHFSIVDSEGNAVSMTTTIEQGFGSRIMSDGGTGLPGGFLLNNELTDFSFSPVDDKGRPVANRVEPGKRPRSSMSPTLILDRHSETFVATLGSPGGAAIIPYTARTIVGMFEAGLDAREVVKLPNFVNLNGPTYLEEGKFPGEITEILEEKGHEIKVQPMTSGLHIIYRSGTGYSGAADPRREGTVAGN